MTDVITRAGWWEIEGGDAVKTVASHDSPRGVRGNADFVANGTDDHLVIQQAIDSLPASGGKVVLSTGTFNGHVRILKANVALVGQGWSTVIKIQAGAVLRDSDCPVRVLADNCYVGHLTVDGNKAAQTHLGDWEADSSLVREFDGVAIYANRCMVDNVRAQNCLGHHIIVWSDPFALETVAGGARHGNVVQDCWIMDIGGRNTLDFASTWELGEDYDQNINYGNVIRGCMLFGGANIVIHTGWDTLVEGCVVQGGGSILFHTNCRRVAFRSNVVIGSTVSHISLNGGLAAAATEARRRSRDCVVEGNTIYGGAGSGTGIGCSHLTDCVVRNNVIIESANRGILFEQCEGLSIESNQIRGSAEQAIFQTGSLEADRCHDIVIRDNFVRGTATKFSITFNRVTRAFIKGNIIYDGDRGINCQSDAVSMTIEGNTIENSTSQGIVLTGHTGTVVVGNTLKGPSTQATITGNDMKVLNNTFAGDGVTAISMQVAATGNVIMGNVFDVSAAVPIFNIPTGTGTVIKNNTKFTTEAFGTATIPSGSTFIAVTHGLHRVPTAANIKVTPTNNLGSAALFWVSDVGATTFRINVDVDPAGDATFAWQGAF